MDFNCFFLLFVLGRPGFRCVLILLGVVTLLFLVDDFPDDAGVRTLLDDVVRRVVDDVDDDFPVVRREDDGVLGLLLFRFIFFFEYTAMSISTIKNDNTIYISMYLSISILCVLVISTHVCQHVLIYLSFVFNRFNRTRTFIYHCNVYFFVTLK